MKAITTKFLGQTETLPSRIVAFDLDQNRIVVSVHDCPDMGEDGHRWAARQLANKMGWTGRLATGAEKGGYDHVFTDDAWRLNSGGTK